MIALTRAAHRDTSMCLTSCSFETQPVADTMLFQVSHLQWFSCGAATDGSVGTSGCSALQQAQELNRCQQSRTAVHAVLDQESAWKNHPPVAKN